MKTLYRQQARRRGLRAALAVAGLAGTVIAAAGHAAESQPGGEAAVEPGKVDDAKHNMQIPTAGCCDWRFWGPPAPPEMTESALDRLRTALGEPLPDLAS